MIRRSFLTSPVAWPLVVPLTATTPRAGDVPHEVAKAARGLGRAVDATRLRDRLHEYDTAVVEYRELDDLDRCDDDHERACREAAARVRQTADEVFDAMQPYAAVVVDGRLVVTGNTEDFVADLANALDPIISIPGALLAVLDTPAD